MSSLNIAKTDARVLNPTNGCADVVDEMRRCHSTFMDDYTNGVSSASCTLKDVLVSTLKKGLRDVTEVVDCELEQRRETAIERIGRIEEDPFYARDNQAYETALNGLSRALYFMIHAVNQLEKRGITILEGGMTDTYGVGIGAKLKILEEAAERALALENANGGVRRG